MLDGGTTSFRLNLSTQLTAAITSGATLGPLTGTKALSGLASGGPPIQTDAATSPLNVGASQAHPGRVPPHGAQLSATKPTFGSALTLPVSKLANAERASRINRVRLTKPQQNTSGMCVHLPATLARSASSYLLAWPWPLALWPNLLGKGPWPCVAMAAWHKFS